jgi:hypothetical protein
MFILHCGDEGVSMKDINHSLFFPPRPLQHLSPFVRGAKPLNIILNLYLALDHEYLGAISTYSTTQIQLVLIGHSHHFY